MKHILTVAVLLLVLNAARAQVETLKKDPSTNAITESFTIGSGKTLTIGSDGTLNASAGTLVGFSTGLTIGTSTITSGTSGAILYNNAGTLGEILTSSTGASAAGKVPLYGGSSELYAGGGFRTSASSGVVKSSLTGDALYFYQADDTIGTLTRATLTGDRIWTLPNVSGTIITTGDSGTVSSTMLATSGVTAATYTNATVTINSKGQVTSASNGAGGSFSSITGSPGDNAALQAALDAKAPLASPTFTGTPSLPTGTTAVTQSARDNSTKIATTAYVDDLYQYKTAIDNALTIAGTLSSARLATAAALDACTYANGTAGVGATLEKNTNGALTVDGVSPSVNDRIIVKNQSNNAHNGVYTVTVVGSGAAKWKLTRATDADASAEILNYVAYTSAGTANAGKSYVARSSGGGAITFGTTLIGFMEYKIYETDPGVAFIRADGSNVTGDGSPARPYGPSGGQTAYNAGFKHFDVGHNCDIGTIAPSIDNDELFFRGRGKTSKVYVQTFGKSITLWDSAGISMWIGCLTETTGGPTPGPSGDLVIHYGYCVLVGTNGAEGTVGNGYEGWPAGDLTLHGPMAVSQAAEARGGPAGDDGDSGIYDGGPGGSIWIGPGVKFLSTAVGIIVEGGTGINCGNTGAEGTIHLQMCDTGPCTVGANATVVASVVNGVPTGFNSFRVGNATLVAGTVTVADASITANTIVLLTRKTNGGTPSTDITYTTDPGVGFTITDGTGLDESVFSYQLIEQP